MSDLFKQPTAGGGKYIKLDDFEGLLILFKPESVDDVPAYQEPTKMVEEVTAEYWVGFGPTGEDIVFGAKFKGATMVRSAKEALRDVEHPFVLGVLQKIPTNATRDKLKIEQTPEAFHAAREEWLRKGAKDKDKPGHVWTLGKFTDEQAAQAAAFIETRNRAADPFKAASN